MITERDLIEAIAECQGERNPNANTCIKLAAFYTLHREMFGEDKRTQLSDTASLDSDSEFAQAVNGKSFGEVLQLFDELMTTLQAVNPRLYAAVLRKL